MAEKSRKKPQPPAPSVKTKSSIGILPANKEYRQWFRRTRRSTRAQGYFHYSGDDQELAEMTRFTIPDDFAATPKVVRRSGSNKKRRRNAEPSSGENEGSLSVGFFVAVLYFELIDQ